MTADKIKARISEMATLFGFEYAGKSGYVDPYYDPATKQDNFILFYNGTDQTVQSAEDVMSTPFIDGKALVDIADKIEITEW